MQLEWAILKAVITKGNKKGESMKILIIFAFIIISVFIYSCLKISSKCSRIEEQQNNKKV